MILPNLKNLLFGIQLMTLGILAMRSVMLDGKENTTCVDTEKSCVEIVAICGMETLNATTISSYAMSKFLLDTISIDKT